VQTFIAIMAGIVIVVCIAALFAIRSDDHYNGGAHRGSEKPREGGTTAMPAQVRPSPPPPQRHRRR